MQNQTLLERIGYMNAVMSVLSDEIQSVYIEAAVEDDEEDLMLAHLLQDKTANLGFLLLDIIKEELDEIKEASLSEKNFIHPLLENAGNVEVNESAQAKDGMNMVDLPLVQP